MKYYLAIDAGGSRTRCLLADEKRVLARASSGTVKLMRTGEQEATARLLAMLAEVASAAGMSLGQITRTCFGLAGASIPAVREWAGRAVAELVTGELLLCGDEEIALDAAFGGGPGILVVAGTGSNAIGRTDAGAIFGAGGWGPALGDEGSGHWIGLEAVRAAVRAQDRDPHGVATTTLLREIERHWELNSLGELIAYANQRGGYDEAAPDFASLAPLVARCAEQGDALAAEVLQRAGQELATLVALVYHKINGDSAPQTSHHEPRAANLKIAFTGGVLTHIAPVRAAMTAWLGVTLPAVRVRQTPVDPLDGALWRARRSE